MYHIPTQVLPLHPLHDALPIFPARMGAAAKAPSPWIADGLNSKTERVSCSGIGFCRSRSARRGVVDRPEDSAVFSDRRSEEHTSELQSLRHLVCRLLL